ncbi:MAG: pyridoxamine 5'-phosphate oxidase [Bryobacteraceae bacterium]
MAQFLEGDPLGLSLEELRLEYKRGALDEAHCDPNPIEQFRRWITDARTADLPEPNAMTLSTATADGRPSGRIVLLKELTPEELLFYTNYTSRKGREMESNPFVSLTFYWAELERQVRVEGRVRRVSRGKSEAYFRGRPKGSRLGALASHQSTRLPSRAPLEQTLSDLEAKYRDSDDIPTPEWWGGYAVRPDLFEFWQGRPNRLHDRIVYSRTGETGWEVGRLSP